MTNSTVRQQVAIALESQNFTLQTELRSSNNKPQELGRQTPFTVESARNDISTITSQNLRGSGTNALLTNASTLNPVPRYVEALVQKGQYRWQNNLLGQSITLTYSFMEKLPSYYKPSRQGQWDDGGQISDFKPMTRVQRNAVRLALQEWQKVSGITFKAVPDGRTVQIRFGTANPLDGSLGWSNYPNSGNLLAGDTWLNHQEPSNRNPIPGSYGFSTILHEIGHALGLSHPFDEVIRLKKAKQTVQYTVMAYNKHPYLPERYQPHAPMLYDIAAIQYLYGKNPITNSGDTVYRWKPNQPFIETIYDTEGTDAVNAHNQRQNVVINLEPGQFSSIGGFRGRPIKENVAIAFGVTLENAIGGVGNDRLVGNAETNTLIGNSGADTLIGNAGNDTLIGNAGNDRLTGGTGDDSFVFQTQNDGIDTITDFAQGNDVINISPLLAQVGYTGTDPLLEGVITASIQQGNTVLLFDKDGFGVIEAATPFAILENFTNIQTLNSATKFVIT